MRLQHLFAILFLFSSLVFAQQYPSAAAERFIFYESTNDYKPNTTVTQSYQPQFQRFFKVKYIEIPAKKLNVSESTAGAPETSAQFIFEKNGEKMVRFFIHPDSEHLYQKLIDRYGVAGEYWVAPTSSTRSVLAWPTQDNGQPAIFLKLSLAQKQDGMGRIIPDWEVRRSVGISQLVAATPQSIWAQHGAFIIPEVAGASIKKSENLPFYVDATQGDVFEHGLIVRDASFLATDSKNEFRPLFSLFTEINGQEPVIISMWKNSKYKKFEDFVDKVFYKDFIEKNSYLFFHQGIVPEIHGQNVLVEFDPEKQEIVRYLHRDVGSMKVDLRLRWINGLDTSMLRTPNSAFDFKFARSTEVYQKAFTAYLNDWLFKWGYASTIQKYVPRFDSEKTKSLLESRLLAHLQTVLPLKSRRLSKTILEHMETYYYEHPIFNSKPLEGPFDNDKVQEFIKSQFKKNQFMELPESWKDDLKLNREGYMVTEYGILQQAGNTIRLIFHASTDLTEITSQKKLVPQIEIKRNARKRIGFYSGTFDPPHKGHKELIEKAIRELQLDVMYIIPNIDPSHKPGASSNEDRLEMAKLGFSDIPKVVVADPEHMRIVETLGIGGFQRYLSEKFSRDIIYQVMGDDSYRRLAENPKITFPPNFVIAVTARDSENEILEVTLKNAPVVKLQSDDSGYSSTLFRNKIRWRYSPTEILPRVLDYIFARGLYQDMVPLCKYLF